MRRSLIFSAVAASCSLACWALPNWVAAADPWLEPRTSESWQSPVIYYSATTRSALRSRQDVEPKVSHQALSQPALSHQALVRQVSLLGGTKLIWAKKDSNELVGVEIRGANANDRVLDTISQVTDLRMLLLAPDRPQQLTDRGVAKLANLTQLEYLGLAGTSVTDAGLAELQNMPQLKRLELPAGTTDAGMAVLAQLPQLEQLRVWPARITNEGLQQIAQSRCLRYLDLSGTDVNDEGVAALRSLHGLETLDLRNTQVTAAVLRHLVPQMDEDLMYTQGPNLLQKLFLNPNTVLESAQVDDLIRLLGMCEIDTSRPQPEPGKAPRPAETVSPELTKTWLDRAKLEGYRLEISYWRALGAYVEFAASLDLDPAAPVPAELLEGTMTSLKLEQLSRFFQAQASQHILGLHFVRPITKDDRKRDDTIFPSGLGNRVLPPKLERLSLRDTEITVTTFMNVVGPAIRGGTPIKVINVFNTATRATEPLVKEGQEPLLGRPGKGRSSHIPFSPGQPELTIPGAPGRPTLTPEDLRSLEEVLAKVDRLIMTDEQAERFKAALPNLAGKVKARPRYLPGEQQHCEENPDGTLRPTYSGPLN
ncbi:MAG: leucine-rich repeat domain-containing protein [Planctomycetota bacterium]